MKLATMKNGRRDGALMLVSGDRERWVSTSEFAPNLQVALENWAEVAPGLKKLSAALDNGEVTGERFDAALAECPLPRAFQWLDGSAYLAHGRQMTKAFKLAANAQFDGTPLMYQGGSDRFIAPLDDAPFVSEADGIDFEGEFAVVVDEVPMGIKAAAALSHIQLVMLANDWSCRELGPREMKSGFGFVQAKPATSFGPIAVTPDELGAAWSAGRIDLPMRVWRDGVLFGNVPGLGMDYDFGQLIEHAARTRTLSAGTIIGSGTVSVGDPFGVGSSCISERRGGEMIEFGEPQTGYLRFGERVRVEVLDAEGISVFGAIEQTVVKGGK
jgi:fumarylacetoacetate (FAA) hydrolase